MSMRLPRICCIIAVELTLLTLSATQATATAPRLRPPAVPLVAHDPYFSIWSQADRLTDVGTTHWTGKPQPLRSLLRVDGKAYRVMGVDPPDVLALPQTDVVVFPTRTVCRFANSQIALTLTFLTPALPSDLEVLTRPLTYLVWEVRSVDGQPHAVQLYFDASAELVVDQPTQEVVWDKPVVEGLGVLKMGTKSQPVLKRKGDDLRIDWGYLYVAVASQQQARLAIAEGDKARKQFAEKGSVPKDSEKSSPPAVCNTAPVLAAMFDLLQVDQQPISRQLMIAYDDVQAVKYFDSQLRPYWQHDGVKPTDMLQAAARDYASLALRCDKFDEQLLADLTHAGGPHYAMLCSLAYRQTLAGNKIAADANGMPLVFPKENFSNGCISTVDVLFPQAPFYLAFSPMLTKGMLVPILDYAASPAWKYPYAPHDLGTYPHATGQIYGMAGGDGGRMPVEESGNMLIMLAALARAEGNADFAKKYWPTLTRWADYLAANGLDPENQLCSADMFGHLPHCANLAMKAIIGLGGYSQLCRQVGKPDDAKRYMDVARRYAARWQDLAKDDGRTRLAYHLPGSWGMKHNLIWDRILETNLFPTAIGDAEVAWYLKTQKRYGLPVDNRTSTSLIDWAMWSIAPARDEHVFQALIEPIFNYANETPSRVPLSDWYVVTDGRQKGFQARSVVGGLFIRLLTNHDGWTRQATPNNRQAGEWTALPMMRHRIKASREIVPTAQKQPITWRYTTEKPGDDWMHPDFDDSAWKQGPAGFGTEETPNAVVRTKWHTKDIWMRREFTLGPDKLRDPQIVAHCDEDGTVYINGVLAAELYGWTTNYEQFDIDREALRALHPGKNILTVHCQQTYGGQYIDAGIVDSRGD